MGTDRIIHDNLNPQDNRIQIAKEYASKGWHVFPCCWPDDKGNCACPGKWSRALNRYVPHIGNEIGKAPIISKWQNRPDTKSTTTAAGVEAFARQFPGCNFGGWYPNMIGSDVDRDKGGFDSLTRLQEKHGPLPPTLTHQTGGGGLHILYVDNKGRDIGNTTAMAGYPGLDRRGNGGQVLLPGSKHRSGGVYSVYKDLPIAEVPDWLAEIDTLEQGSHLNLNLNSESNQPIPHGQQDDWLTRRAWAYAGKGDSEQAIAAKLKIDVAERFIDQDPNDPWTDQHVEDKARRAFEQYKLKGNEYRDNIGGNGHKGQNVPMGEDNAAAIEDAIKHRTPLGLAKRLVKKHGENLRYCYEYEKWLIYDGKRWVIDSGAGAVSLIKDIVRDLYIEAAKESDKSERDAIAKYALGCERGNTLNDALFLAQSEPGISIKTRELDTNSWLLNCLNGTVDLKNGQLLQHDRQHLITKLVNLNYHPDTECPTWIKTLHFATNNDHDLEFYLQRVFGYLLTGDVSECALFFFFGPTKTGKTTITGTIYDILGSDYAKDTPVSTITVNKYNNQANDDLARLAGSRMVKVSETESGSKLATGLIKYLTGNESEITGKFLYKERFNYKPTFKIVMTGNVKPKIPGNDQAMYERLHLIPFRSYVPPKDRIKDLRDAVLKQEHEGILAWCVRGCLAYIENGDLGKPKTVNDEVKEYQKEMDTAGQWLDECCTIDPARKTPLATLFASYDQWCKETDNEPMTKKKFSQDLDDRGFSAYREDKERGKCGLYVGKPGI